MKVLQHFYCNMTWKRRHIPSESCLATSQSIQLWSFHGLLLDDHTIYHGHFYHCSCKNRLYIWVIRTCKDFKFWVSKLKIFDCCNGQIWTLCYVIPLTVNFPSPAVHCSWFMMAGRVTVDTFVSADPASLPFLQSIAFIWVWVSKPARALLPHLDGIMRPRVFARAASLAFTVRCMWQF